MADPIIVDEDGTLRGGRRVDVTFVVKSTWAYEASGDDPERGVMFPELQDEDDARAEIQQLFVEYLTGRYNPFREDYGPGAWGGWDGPFVLDVQVSRGD